MKKKKEIIKGKLIEVLQTLNPKEFNRFILFVKSPYFNKKEKLRLFIDFIAPFYPQFSDKAFTYSDAHLQIFDNTFQSKSKIHTCKKELLDLLKHFLKIEALKESQHIQSKLLLSKFDEKKIQNLFKKELKNAIDRLSDSAQDIDSLIHNLDLLKIEFSNEIKQRSRAVDFKYIKNTNDTIDSVYLLEKLRFACVLMNRFKSISVEMQSNENPYLEDQVNTIEAKVLEKHPILRLYLLLYKLLKSEQNNEQEENSNYSVLKEFIINNGYKICKPELRQVCTGLINYGSRKLGQKKQDYLQEVFDWYEYALTNEIIIEGNSITPYQHYRNIVVVSLRLNKLNWVEDFITRYKEFIIPTVREQLYLFCLAELYFYQEKYKKTLEKLTEFKILEGEEAHKTSDMIQHIEYVRLMIKTYYELSYFMSLSNLIHALETFLSRNKEKLTTSWLYGTRNFLIITKKLIKIKEDPGYNKSKEALETTLKSMNFLAEKKWIIEKLNICFE